MSDAGDLPILSVAELRVLGCLVEKRETTPDIYPMTLNGLQAAANQKTSRDPVLALELSEISRALGQLERHGLVHRAFASRVERFEHRLGQRFSLTQPQAAILALLMLRGPQTAHELLARSERMARFAGIDMLNAELDLLVGRNPPLVVELGRAPGQREQRFAHLLGGPVETVSAPVSAPARVAPPSDLEARVAALEEKVAQLAARLAQLAGEG